MFGLLLRVKARWPFLASVRSMLTSYHKSFTRQAYVRAGLDLCPSPVPPTPRLFHPPFTAMERLARARCIPPTLPSPSPGCLMQHRVDLS